MNVCSSRMHLMNKIYFLQVFFMATFKRFTYLLDILFLIFIGSFFGKLNSIRSRESGKILLKYIEFIISFFCFPAKTIIKLTIKNKRALDPICEGLLK